MKIAVVGGTGLIGTRLVASLRAMGHEVRVAARSAGVNVLTGQGLDEALAGADAVVDVSNPGYSDALEMALFFERSTPILLASERAAGTRHHVILSVVGAPAVGSGYYRAKARQEQIVASSGIPFTIARSTPFFEFLYWIVDAGGEGGDIRLPPVLTQPIAGDDAAGALAQLALQSPADRVVELAGPDTYRLPTLAEEILTANEDPRRVIADPEAPYFGARLGAASLMPSQGAFRAATHFEDWLRQSLAVPLRHYDGSTRRLETRPQPS